MQVGLRSVKAGLLAAFITVNVAVLPVAAQDPTSSEIATLLEEVAEAIAFEQANPGSPSAYDALRPHLLDLADLVPGLDFYVVLADVEMASAESAEALKLAVARIENLAEQGAGSAEAAAVATQLVEALVASEDTAVKLPSSLEALGKELDQLDALGVKVDVPGATILKDAIKLAKLALSAAELENRDAEALVEFTGNVADYLPPHLVPALGGHALEAFKEKLVWDEKMYEASTEGLNIVSEAIETGQFDSERYEKLAAEIEALANAGPWDGDNASQFLKEFIAEVPLIGPLVNALWSAAEESESICDAISCDCDNLDFGILTGPYRDECRAAEQALKNACSASGGQIQGSCHPTASGPNPHIPGS
jgi:hypothetical protein